MSSTKKTFIVLDTASHINALIRASEYYAQPRQVMTATMVMDPVEKELVETDGEVTVEAIPKMTRARAMLILTAMYKEVLSSSLFYRSFDDQLDVVAMALRDCAVPEEIDRVVAEDYLGLDEVDNVQIEVQNSVTSYLGGKVWQQWDLIETPYLLALLGGQDYRIAQWERANGHDHRDDDMTLTVDVATVANYIKQQLILYRGETVAAQIPIAPIIADAIQRRYPLVEFSNHKTVPYEQIQTLLGTDYEHFYNTFIRQVIDAFRSYFLIANLDSSIPYRGEVTKTFNLVFCATKLPRNDEERYFHDLKQSIELGDWVPEAEHRRLNEYERRHPL